jgi:hypothetical protein
MAAPISPNSKGTTIRRIPTLQRKRGRKAPLRSFVQKDPTAGLGETNRFQPAPQT